MRYNEFQKFRDERVLVYIEEFNKKENYVIFDFLDSNGFDLFTKFLGISADPSGASMVRLINYQSRTIQENTYYSVNKETIESLSVDEEFDQGTSLLLFNSFVVKKGQDIFLESVSLNYEEKNWLGCIVKSGNPISKIDTDINGINNVVIRNIGQGNWNEIYCNKKPKWVYDMGAPTNASKTEVSSIIGKKNVEYSSSKPNLVLSHWDKDHYHSLIGFTDKELAHLGAFVCRDYLPTNTSHKIYDRINKAKKGNDIYTIPSAVKLHRGRPTYLKPITSTKKQLVIYNAQQHKNRNTNGIALCLKTRTKSIIFGGDLTYRQLSRDILSTLSFKHNHYLIVPHHGGNAGVYTYNKPSTVNLEKAIISVGRNSWDHPLTKYTSKLMKDFNKVESTKIKSSDIIITL